MNDARLPKDPPTKMTDEERRELERGRVLMKTMTHAVRMARQSIRDNAVTDGDRND